MVDGFIDKIIGAQVEKGTISEQDINIYKYGYFLLYECPFPAYVHLFFSNFLRKETTNVQSKNETSYCGHRRHRGHLADPAHAGLLHHDRHSDQCGDLRRYFSDDPRKDRRRSGLSRRGRVCRPRRYCQQDRHGGECLRSSLLSAGEAGQQYHQ